MGFVSEVARTLPIDSALIIEADFCVLRNQVVNRYQITGIPPLLFVDRLTEMLADPGSSYYPVLQN